MNKLRLLTLIITLALSGITRANDGTFFTKVIHESDSTYTLNFSAKKWMKIINFIQEGGDLVDNGSGFFSPAIGSVVVSQGATALKPVTVATAGGPNSSVEVYVTGPVTITIAPVPGGTLYITYLAGNN
jgi:hypothetical protein